MSCKFLPRLLTSVSLGLPLASVGNPIPDSLYETSTGSTLPEQGIELFFQPSFGASRMFWSRAGSTSPKAVEDVDDQLRTGAAVTVEIGAVGRERGLGVAVFYDLHTRSASAQVPFDRSVPFAESESTGTWTESYRKFDPSLQVHTLGMELVKQGDLGSPDLGWTASFGLGYVLSRLEASYERQQAGTDSPVSSASEEQTGEGAAILVGAGLLWRVSPNLAFGTGMRYVYGGTITNAQRIQQPLLGVSSQRIDHLGLTLGARVSL